MARIGHFPWQASLASGALPSRVFGKKRHALGAMLAVGALHISTAPAMAAPPTGGTVSVEAVHDAAGSNQSTEAFVDAAVRLLSEKGFTLLDGPGHAAFVMQLSVSRSDVGTGSGKVTGRGPDVVHGGALGSVGSGVSITMPSRKSQLVAIERITLDMRLRKRGDDAVIWHGTAITVRSAAAQRSAAADLSSALLRSYPAQPEATISVP